MKEEAASAPHTLSPKGEPEFPSRFQVPSMPQLDFFLVMTLETIQAYINFWYVQAQTQTQVGQSQYPVPPTVTPAQPPAQSIVKFSKLIKEAR